MARNVIVIEGPIGDEGTFGKITLFPPLTVYVVFGTFLNGIFPVTVISVQFEIEIVKNNDAKSNVTSFDKLKSSVIAYRCANLNNKVEGDNACIVIIEIRSSKSA